MSTASQSLQAWEPQEWNSVLFAEAHGLLLVLASEVIHAIGGEGKPSHHFLFGSWDSAWVCLPSADLLLLLLFVNAIQERGALVSELPPSTWAMDKPVGPFS